MSKRANPTLIGMFILGMMVLIVVGVVALAPRVLVGDRPLFVSFFEESVNGLNIGAPVMFQGVPVGEVVEVGLWIDSEDMTSLAPVQYRIDLSELDAAARDIIDLEDEEVLRAHVAGGLRAQLEMESIVTGLLIVNLGYVDDPPPARPVAHAGQLVIPTTPSPFVGIEVEARALTATTRRVLDQVADILDQLEAEEIGDALMASARAVQQLAESPEVRAALRELPVVAAELRETMAGVQALTERVGLAVDPFEVNMATVAEEATLALQVVREVVEGIPGAVTADAGVGYRIEEALISLRQAADAIRQLAESLEQDPSMLIRGRSPDQ